jgi:enoyl-CoA hydratase/carnithine racemase
MTEYIKTELSDGVLVLTLQRPDKNALTGAMYNVLSDALGSGGDEGGRQGRLVPGRRRQFHRGQ